MSSKIAADTIACPNEVVRTPCSCKTLTVAGIEVMDRTTPTKKLWASFNSPSGNTHMPSANPPVRGNRAPPSAMNSDERDARPISLGFMSMPACSTRKKIPACATNASSSERTRRSNPGARLPKPKISAARTAPANNSPTESGSLSLAAPAPKIRVASNSNKRPKRISIQKF